jgi:hypothetical protein
MNVKNVTVLIILVLVCTSINYLIIKPMSINFVDSQLKETISGYITYKNNQKGFYLYVVDDSATVERLHLDTLYESEAFDKPQLNTDIKHIIFADSQFYRVSHIGDKIEKLPNSNKCILIGKKAASRFNCYSISSEMQVKIGKVEEWQPTEIGLWRR